MTSPFRPLTLGEIDLARGMFGEAIDYPRVRLVRAKWAFFQPRETVMAPCGHIHFHPEGSTWREDFAVAALPSQALFIHEMTHVWQAQRGGRWYLPLMRHPFCRYRYILVPGRPFAHYGIEQQAMLVEHAFLLERGANVPGAPPLAAISALLPFPRPNSRHR